jgi:predicted dehydrogenase
LPVLDRNPRFEVVGVMDRTPGLARRVAAVRGYRRFHEGDDIEDVSWLDEVDAVVIGTSPFTRRSLIQGALLRGKHVLTEKPFAMTLTDGEEMVRLSRTRSLILAIVHNFQFASSTKRLIKDIRRGKLGRIRAIVAWQFGNPRRRLPGWHEKLPLGLFYDESPHLFYLLRLLSPGPLRLLTSVVFPSTAGLVTPALVHAQYSCTCPDGIGIPAGLSMGFESPISEWHISLHGEHALGDVDIFRDIYIRLPNDGEHRSMDVLRTSFLASAQHWGQHLSRGPLHLAGRLFYGNEEVFDRFGRAIESGIPPEGISANDALEVLRLQYEVLERQTRLA